MKKLLFMFALIMGVVSANAQIATENAKFFDNTYVGVEAGATTPLNFNSVFPVNPVIGVKIGKELTPVFGVEIEGLAVMGTNFYRYGFNGSIPTDGAFNVHKNGSVNTFVKATNVGLNGVINWSNLLFGYNGTPRTFEVKTNTGIGWLHYFGTYSPKFEIGGYVPAGRKNVLTAKTAVDLAFNLGAKKAHTITVSPGIYWGLNAVDNIKFNKNYAQFALMVGYTYHFKTSNGTHHFKTYDVGAMIDEINRLNEELAKKPKEVVVEKVVEKKVELPATDAVSVADKNGETWIVTFATGSAKLTREAKFILNQVGNDAIVNVTATASPDGSAKFNQKLSEKRAKAVADFLTARGVKVNSAEGKGVDSEKGRSAVVKTLQ